MFDSAGEPAAQPGDAFACVPDGYACGFEFGRATLCDEVPSLVQSAPMGLASTL